jgi:creatinine amidohydrolase
MAQTRLADLNWMQVEAYLETDGRLMLVLGACEQHGHLSLLTDIHIPQRIAQLAAERTGVLVAPAFPFGYSSFFDAYPGNLSVSLDSLTAVVLDVIRSAHRQGFRGILILNGHGGNADVEPALRGLALELSGLKVDFQAWWECPPVQSVLDRHGLTAYHAGGAEAFPFNRVAPLPGGEKAEVEIPEVEEISPEGWRELAGDGVFGGPYVLSEELYPLILEAAVADAVARLEGLRSQRE